MYCINPECPDYVETGSPSEYVEGVEACPVCGAALVAELPEQDDDAQLTSDDVEPVFEVTEPTEIEVVKSVLNAAQIPFVIQGQDQLEAYRAGHAAFRFFPLSGAIRFCVPADRAEEARILLTENELPDEETD